MANSFAFADIEDTSVIDALSKQEDLKADFKLKTFSSCEDMNKVMKDYIKTYYKNNGNLYYRWWPVMMEKASVNKTTETSSAEVSVAKELWWGGSEDFSSTNTQVLWVDESEIIKTDWKYIYYHNKKDNTIYVVDSRDVKNPKVVKKIKLPEYFYNISLYVDNSKLSIVASGNDSREYKTYSINRNEKTYAITYDISSIDKISLLKLYAVDWSITNSRRIGDYLYIISTNYFNIPYYSFKNVDDIQIWKIIPQKIDLSYTNIKANQNYKSKNKTLPYNIKSWDVAKCNEIEYILPDVNTIKDYKFNPSYNIISIIDLSDTKKEVNTKVIAWNNSDIYMSKNNLYMTSSLYTNYNFSCPFNAKCMVPFYYGWTQNTLVHKLNIKENTLSYKDSAIIPWSPLNQYSMDEKDGKFRIITSQNNFGNNSKNQTDLYILDENLDNYSSLKWLWIWENFQSSRFINDKLFLVTFEQTDPLFVIDLLDQKNPKLIWELKIPGYSTYLHPYDDNHLIGLGYDTITNQWGWVQNWWIKLDLYEINYNKKDEKNPDLIDIKQLYTQTIWDAWTYTEATYNPRMFIWNSAKNILLLPMTIQLNTTKTSYDVIDYFNWLVAFDINKNTWIKQKYKITHIDTSWLKEKKDIECKTYSEEQKKSSECKILLDWSKYCPSNNYYYIPNYCYKDSTLWVYLSSHSWEFNNSFINRSLFINDTSFAISNDKISSHDIFSWDQKWYTELK